MFVNLPVAEFVARRIPKIKFQNLDFTLTGFNFRLWNLDSKIQIILSLKFGRTIAQGLRRLRETPLISQAIKCLKGKAKPWTLSQAH